MKLAGQIVKVVASLLYLRYCLVRASGLGKPRNARCDHVPDEPGVEMQHTLDDLTRRRKHEAAARAALTAEIVR